MKLDRRTLMVGGGVGVGLVVGFAVWPRHLQSDLAVRKGEQTFGNFIRIARDGRVTVAIPQAETGQGIWTALPQVVADELGAAWESVAVEPAPLTNAYANPLAKAEGWPKDLRITAQSTSVRAFEQPMREAAAVAREMLVGAAADRWNVAPEECEAIDGLVILGPRTFTFGELAEEAAHRNPPRKPKLRQPGARLMGKPLQRLDGPSKADGSLRFAGDVRLPGMLFASVRIAPPGGRLRAFSREPIRRVAGVRHVVARDEWIAVVADNWWAAEQAVKAADATFSGPASPAELRPLYEDALANGSPRTVFERGDYDDAVQGSRPLAATYFVAPTPHLDLEPTSATARFRGARLEVWAATQAPGLARAAAARSAGLGESDVAFYPLPVGAPSGRAIEADAVPYAIALARVINAPVQVILSQSGSQNHDRVSAGALARMTALPGEGGITGAWKMRVATADGLGSAIARMRGTKDQAGTLRDSAPPYSIPNAAVEAIRADLPVAAGYMRGSPQRELTFFTESFIDELARAAGMEPLAFRMAMLGSNGRLARCLQGAARLGRWDGGGPGSVMGIAGASAFGSHIGLVATATIDERQRIKVSRLAAAVDCGQTVNPGLVEQQIEGGLIWALAQATAAAPSWVAGMPRARPHGDVLPRIGDAPEIVVQLIPSSDPPGGVSGLGTTVLAPAVANAIYAGTGRRLRDLPFEAV